MKQILDTISGSSKLLSIRICIMKRLYLTEQRQKTNYFVKFRKTIHKNLRRFLRLIENSLILGKGGGAFNTLSRNAKICQDIYKVLFKAIR